ncbi:uncharacterized protein LOC106662064 [Cimex lectularius]|uniref:Osiris n=1 Tax=Cimex lectularius TaxID=79782 RepID=A0A8I6RDS5_CIMLE|nr:uncharacterized protein LOC106662064 [Cimex lectularius]
MHVRSLSVLLVVAVAAASGESFEGNLRVLYRSLEKCNEKGNDLGTCLRLKAVTMLDRALDSESPVVINDFLSLTPDKNAPRNETARSESEISSNLPADPEKKDSKLDEMIADKMTRFLQSRSLQFTVPAADIVEGRKKSKKGGPILMAALAMGGMMVQMAMGKIALLAGKALLIGKMALLLSAIIGLKKLVGGGGGGESHQVVYAEGHGGGHSGGGWGRSYEREVAQDMAYHAQARSQ